jgi:hypothetical protein
VEGGGRGEGKLLLVQGRSVGERFAQIDIFLLITSSAHCYPAHKNNGIFKSLLPFEAKKMSYIEKKPGS